MLAGLRKNFQTSNIYLCALLISLFLLLGSGQDLFHNHEPDLKHHHDCPGYQLNLLFSSVLIIDCVFFFIISLIVTLKYFQSEFHHAYFSDHYYSRAPPFQILNTKLSSY
jgi:hypothetical protein